MANADAVINATGSLVQASGVIAFNVTQNSMLNKMSWLTQNGKQGNTVLLHVEDLLARVSPLRGPNTSLSYIPQVMFWCGSQSIHALIEAGAYLSISWLWKPSLVALYQEAKKFITKTLTDRIIIRIIWRFCLDQNMLSYTRKNQENGVLVKSKLLARNAKWSFWQSVPEFSQIIQRTRKSIVLLRASKPLGRVLWGRTTKLSEGKADVELTKLQSRKLWFKPSSHIGATGVGFAALKTQTALTTLSHATDTGHISWPTSGLFAVPAIAVKAIDGLIRWCEPRRRFEFVVS